MTTVLDRETMLVANLMLYSPELQRFAASVGGIWNVGLKELKAIKSLEDMAREIGRFPFIDQLVIFTHGFEGGMALENGHLYDLREEAVSKAFAKVKTQVEDVRFEGCWVGRGPRGMAAFGRLLNAARVSGYTWEHGCNDITFTFPRGSTAEKVTAIVGPYWRWRAPFPPQAISQLASMARNSDVRRKIPMEWYKFSDDNATPTNPWDVKSLDPMLGPYGFKQRAQATPHAVDWKDAKDAKPEEDPATPFEYVTVEYHGGGRALIGI
jgi:hypothetical protein